MLQVECRLAKERVLVRLRVLCKADVFSSVCAFKEVFCKSLFEFAACVPIYKKGNALHMKTCLQCTNINLFWHATSDPVYCEVC